MRFSTTVVLGGKTATGFEVLPEVVDALGAGKRPPVTVTINGYRYRSTVAVMAGAFMLPLAADHRAAAGLAAGDVVEVDLELDTAAREVDVPPDLAAALDAEPLVRLGFDALSYSKRRAFVLSVEKARSDETRQRRIAKAVQNLREGKGRP